MGLTRCARRDPKGSFVRSIQRINRHGYKWLVPQLRVMSLSCAPAGSVAGSFAMFPGYDQAQRHRLHCCGRTVRYAQFGKDAFDLAIDRIFRDTQNIGDHGIAFAFANPADHIQFALGKIGQFCAERCGQGAVPLEAQLGRN